MHLRQVFDDLEQFLGTYRGLVSRAGMVLPSESLHPKGTILDLKIGLRDGLNLIQGRAGVVGVEESPHRGPGRGNLVLRFVDLDQASVDFIDRMQAREAAEDVPPFDLEQRLASPPRVAGPVAAPPDAPTPEGEAGGDGTRDAETDRPPRLEADDPSSAQEGDEDLERMVADALRDEPEQAAALPAGAGRRGRPPRPGGIRLVVAVLAVAVAVVAALVLRGSRGDDGARAAPTPRLTPPLARVTPRPSPDPTPPGPFPEPQAATVSEPAVEPTPAAGATGPGARRVESITWRQEDGATDVEIVTDAPLEASLLHSAVMSEPPRLLLRLGGILEPYPVLRDKVADPRLEAIRTWHHADRTPPELHVVLDLTPAAAAPPPPEVSGRTIRVRLTGGGGTPP